MTDLAELAARHWDAVIVGTGMGGATIGRTLAEAGATVLFVEQGPEGWPAEEHGLRPDPADPAARLTRGWWPDRVEGTENGRTRRFFAPLGCGAGGSSVFYGGALERFERHDFEDIAGLAHPAGGWPVGYDAFLPWYARAERLFEVSGTPDPLNPDDSPDLIAPPPLSPGEAAMMARLQANGLHPYRLHTGLYRRPDCRECIGHKCPRACKSEARLTGLGPALATGRAALLARCPAVRVEGTPGAVTGVVVRPQDGTDPELVVRGRVVILAAGAFGSPRLLRASASEIWPDGPGNGTDLAGRHLMFHVSDLLAVFAGRGPALEGPRKTLALRDFYRDGATRLGSFQSMGAPAGYGNILGFLQDRFDQSPLARFGALRHGLRLPAAIAARLFGQARIFATVLEDLPDPENRVLFDPDRPEAVRYSYRISPDLAARRLVLARKVARALRPMRSLRLTRELMLNHGHPCGTLRFGTDPRTSVLDPACRVHGVDNLHVVDSSFMPSSAGANPSLTIAANALRVGDIIAGRLQSGEIP